MANTELVSFSEESQLGRARRGTALVVAGRVLLWFDLLLLMFVYMSIKDGSDFWLWWVIVEAVVGGVLVMAGSWYRWRVMHKAVS